MAEAKVVELHYRLDRAGSKVVLYPKIQLPTHHLFQFDHLFTV